MTPENTSQLTAGLLLLSLASVLSIALILSLFVIGHLKRIRSLKLAPAPTPDAPLPTPLNFHANAFDSACRWLAIRSSNAGVVQAALGVQKATPCSWEEGLSKLIQHNLFISPPIQGWILVVGHGLPDPVEDIDRCFQFITSLSRALGHIQFFSSNRPVNHHTWVRSENGKILRGYSWAGETLWNQGDLTNAEKDLNLRCYQYGEPADALTLDGDSHHANSDKILFLAARWSLDPTTINERTLQGAPGMLGDVLPSHRP